MLPCSLLEFAKSSVKVHMISLIRQNVRPFHHVLPMGGGLLSAVKANSWLRRLVLRQKIALPAQQGLCVALPRLDRLISQRLDSSHHSGRRQCRSSTALLCLCSALFCLYSTDTAACQEKGEDSPSLGPEEALSVEIVSLLKRLSQKSSGGLKPLVEMLAEYIWPLFRGPSFVPVCQEMFSVSEELLLDMFVEKIRSHIQCIREEEILFRVSKAHSIKDIVDIFNNLKSQDLALLLEEVCISRLARGKESSLSSYQGEVMKEFGNILQELSSQGDGEAVILSNVLATLQSTIHQLSQWHDQCVRCRDLGQVCREDSESWTLIRRIQISVFTHLLSIVEPSELHHVIFKSRQPEFWEALTHYMVKLSSQNPKQPIFELCREIILSFYRLSLFQKGAEIEGEKLAIHLEHLLKMEEEGRGTEELHGQTEQVEKSYEELLRSVQTYFEYCKTSMGRFLTKFQRESFDLNYYFTFVTPYPVIQNAGQGGDCCRGNEWWRESPMKEWFLAEGKYRLSLEVFRRVATALKPNYDPAQNPEFIIKQIRVHLLLLAFIKHRDRLNQIAVLYMQISETESLKNRAYPKSTRRWWPLLKLK